MAYKKRLVYKGMETGGRQMKLPSYNGWPIMANFSPLEGKWEVKTRHQGLLKGARGAVPLREVLNKFVTRLVIEDNAVSEKPFLPGALCDCGKGYKLKIVDGKGYCAHCGKEVKA